MDNDRRDRWSAIAHRHRRFCSPVDEERFSAFVAGLPVPADPYVVDLGCGKGEALQLVLARFGGTGTGVDRSPRLLPDGAQFVRADAAAWAPPRPPDVALCIGATHIFGGAAATASALSAMVQPGGLIIVGDGYWRSLPTSAQLDRFGMAADELTDLAGLTAAIGAFAVQTSTEAEWDAYEWSLIRSVEAWAAEEGADDPDRDAFLARTALMSETYVEWRRATMGFALLTCRPSPPR